MGETTARLRSAHRLESGLLQHAVDRVTAVLAWPGFVVLLAMLIAGWITGNLVGQKLGFNVPDPPPFVWLEAFVAIGALVVACLILTTQRREDKLADHRSQLILELAIANDQKIAKIIGLIEESRRDNPALTNRIDVEAAQMATPSNAVKVLEVIRELSDEAP